MAKKKQSKEAPARRPRRGYEQRIAELEAKIQAIKEREARKQVKSDPALKFASAALRALDKALSATKDGDTRKSLGEPRAALAEFLAEHGVGRHGDQGGRVRRSASEIEGLADVLLNYVRNNPGQRGEQIAEALAADTTAIRPVMKRLIAAGKVSTEGQRRGMTYSATS